MKMNNESVKAVVSLMIALSLGACGHHRKGDAGATGPMGPSGAAGGQGYGAVWTAFV
jgi:hypothetical protein